MTPNSKMEPKTVEKLLRQLQMMDRCFIAGVPTRLCRIQYPELPHGGRSDPVRLSTSNDSVIIMAQCSNNDGRRLWIQVGDKVHTPLFAETMWLHVPRLESILLNDWDREKYSDYGIAAGHVDLYGWELRRD